MRYYSWWTYLLMALPGIVFYIVNWMIFINNALGKKWSSNIPPLGGVWIAIVFLLSPVKLLALTGLTDAFFVLVLLCIFAPRKNNDIQAPSEGSEEDGGDHAVGKEE